MDERLNIISFINDERNFNLFDIKVFFNMYLATWLFNCLQKKYKMELFHEGKSSYKVLRKNSLKGFIIQFENLL